jgi:hypothetical protein
LGFLLVKYPGRRDVSIDGTQVGITNTPIEVGDGHHLIELAPGVPYVPPAQNVEVDGEPETAPNTISFSPLQES